MICPTCYRMLRGQRGRRWRGTYDLQFSHHTDTFELRKSSEMSEVGCCICRKIWYELQRIESDGRKKSISAFLAEVPQQRGLYRLDFKLGNSSKRLATFLLQQTTSELDAQLYTPLSTNSKSEEVLQLARFWIKKCTQEHENCPNEDFYNRQPFYPSRLIKLNNEGKEKGKVRLISKTKLVVSFYLTFKTSAHCETWRSITFPFVVNPRCIFFTDSKQWIEIIGLSITYNLSRVTYIWLSQVSTLSLHPEITMLMLDRLGMATMLRWATAGVTQIFSASQGTIEMIGSLKASKSIGYPKHFKMPYMLHAIWTLEFNIYG